MNAKLCHVLRETTPELNVACLSYNIVAMAIIKWETIAVIACIVTCLMVKSWLPGLWKETKNVGSSQEAVFFWAR